MSDRWAGVVDAEKAQPAVAVLRVRFVSSLGGNKYSWDKVEVVAVIQNRSSHRLGETIEVAHYSWEPGVPEGESTIYLVPYADAAENRWKLLEGSGSHGVSHAR